MLPTWTRHERVRRTLACHFFHIDHWSCVSSKYSSLHGTRFIPSLFFSDIRATHAPVVIPPLALRSIVLMTRNTVASFNIEQLNVYNMTELEQRVLRTQLACVVCFIARTRSVSEFENSRHVLVTIEGFFNTALSAHTCDLKSVEEKSQKIIHLQRCFVFTFKTIMIIGDVKYIF